MINYIHIVIEYTGFDIKDIWKDLNNITKIRNDLTPIIGDAKKSQNYKFLISILVDCVFVDVAQPDQS